MKIYNYYIDRFYGINPYKSEICFINVNNGSNDDNCNVLIKELTYINFYKYKLNGFYELPYESMIKLNKIIKNDIV